MAEIELFHYTAKKTFLKSIDARIKFPLLMLFTILVYHVSAGGLLFLSLCILILFTVSSYSLKYSLPNMRGILILTLLIAIATYAAGRKTGEALLAALRFDSTIFLGITLIATTLPEEIEKAVYALLKPVPFISAARVATRIRLTITFIPELLNKTREIKDARLSRCIKSERNPVKRIHSLILPLMYGIIENAETTAFAMESRCYSDNKTFTLKKLSTRDYYALAAGLLAAGIGLII